MTKSPLYKVLLLCLITIWLSSYATTAHIHTAQEHEHNSEAHFHSAEGHAHSLHDSLESQHSDHFVDTSVIDLEFDAIPLELKLETLRERVYLRPIPPDSPYRVISQVAYTPRLSASHLAQSYTLLRAPPDFG